MQKCVRSKDVHLCYDDRDGDRVHSVYYSCDMPVSFCRKGGTIMKCEIEEILVYSGGQVISVEYNLLVDNEYPELIDMDTINELELCINKLKSEKK